MEKAKQVINNSNNSSSTFTTKLFGPKQHSSSSSSGTFASVFGPDSTGALGRDHSHNNPATGMIINNNKYGNRGNNERNQKVSENDPCYFSSSIYYGGQQVYSPNNNTTNKSHSPLFKIDEGKDYDSNGNNSIGASRGNWWEGSLYY